jgi:2-C-methyl-D-erythritol 4-phosphate cytidylyltransferase
VVVALRPEDIPWVEEMIAHERFHKPVRCVEGGETRQESVANALASVAEDVELVAVHDAVRPFVSQEIISEVILAAAHHGAAIAGIVPVDTVKQVHRHVVRGTLNRDRLVLAQTPQVFRTGLLRQAFAKAREDGFTGTDESSLVERLETVEIHVVAGSDRNIKITRPSDMELATLFLSLEREQEAG